MRIRVFNDTYTVGLLLKAGQIVDVQPLLAKALLADGRAEDPYAPPKPPEPPKVEVEEPVKEEKPAKKSAAKKAKK